MLIILDTIVNINEGPIWSLRNIKNLHFDNEKDIHAISKNYEESDYKHNLNLKIILY